CDPDSAGEGAMSDTLPTREEIAEIICKSVRVDSNSMTVLATADALLARLRPVWEAERKWRDTEWAKFELREHDRLIDACDALRADVRACAEALHELVADETQVDAVAFGLSVQKACAALARPGVREALR